MRGELGMHDELSPANRRPTEAGAAATASDHGFELTWVIDRATSAIVEANETAFRAMGIGSGGGPAPVNAASVFLPDDLARLLLVVEPLLRRGDTWAGTLTFAHPYRHQRSVRTVVEGRGVDSSGLVAELVCYGRLFDTDEDHLADLAHRATHDPLTGLPNRALLLDRLELALARSTRSLSPTAVFFIDLDDFKAINDIFGHEAGDEALIAIAHQLRAALRPSDTLARLGGDEFVAVCGDVADAAHADIIARRLASSIKDAPDLPSSCSGSIGIAISPDGNTTAAEMLSRSDQSMYEAKKLLAKRLPGEGRSAQTVGARGFGSAGWPVPDQTGSGSRRTPVAIAATPHPRRRGEVRYSKVVDFATGRTVQLVATFVDPVAGTAVQFLDANGEPGWLGAQWELLAGLRSCIEESRQLISLAGGSAPTIAMPAPIDLVHVIINELDDQRATGNLPTDGIVLELEREAAEAMVATSPHALQSLTAGGVPVSIIADPHDELGVDDLLRLSSRLVTIGPDVNHSLPGLLDAAARTNTTVVAAQVSDQRQVDYLVANGCRYGRGPLFGESLDAAATLGQFLNGPVRTGPVRR